MQSWGKKISATENDKEVECVEIPLAVVKEDPNEVASPSKEHGSKFL